MLRGEYILFVMLQKVAEVLQTFQNLYHAGITSETYSFFSFVNLVQMRCRRFLELRFLIPKLHMNVQHSAFLFLFQVNAIILLMCLLLSA